MEKGEKKKVCRTALLASIVGCVLLFSMNPTVCAEDNATRKEDQLIQIARWGGAGAACLLTTSLFVWEIWISPADKEESFFIEDPETWKQVLVAVPSIAVFTAVSGWTMGKFMELYTEWEVKKAWSAPVGMACGAVAGAIIGTTGFTTAIGIGAALDIIDTGTLPNYFAVLGMSILAGGLWGGLSGIVPGLLIGPGISFYMDY